MDWDILYRIFKCCLCLVHVSERTRRGLAESWFFLAKEGVHGNLKVVEGSINDLRASLHEEELLDFKHIDDIY